MSIVERALRKILARRTVNDALNKRMRASLSNSASFSKLMLDYQRYSWVKLERFHYSYNQLCYKPGSILAGDRWSVSLPERTLNLPLDRDDLGLHWETAISVVGHDTALKESYFNLIRSSERPDLFLDVGANYGTHSLIFLASGIRTITFEPNASCAGYFLSACELNGLTPDLQAVAVGSETGTLELVYPEGKTWLGTADPEEIKKIVAAWPNIRRVKVPLVRLDDYVEQWEGARNIVVKIDVEGLEEEVLKGAATLLDRKAPLIAFESIDARGRTGIARVLEGSGYRIARLPWFAADMRLLSADEFLQDRETNFLAFRP